MKRIVAFLMIIPSIICLSNNCSKNPGFEDSYTPYIPPVIPDTPTVVDTAVQSFLALGDSYTIGQSVEADERYPNQTAVWLNANGASVKKPLFIAQTGWTTGNLKGALKMAAITDTFDIVTLLIGVNDQYQGMELDGYAVRFRELLQESIRLTGGRPLRVFVLSIPDYSVTPFVPQSIKQEVSEELNNFNDTNKRITDEYHCRYINVTESSRQAANDPSLIARDNLHFSGIEYKKWANLLGPVILNALKY